MINIIFCEINHIENTKIRELSKDTVTVKVDCSKEFAYQLIEYDLFNTSKTFVLYNMDIFYSKSILNAKKIRILLNLLNNSIYEVVIVLDKKLNMNNKNLKQLNLFNYEELLDTIENKNQYLNNYIKSNNYNISKQNLNILINNLDFNLSSIVSELDKLSCFNTNISLSSINNLSYKNTSSNVFDLISFILNNNYNKSRELFQKLIIEGTKPISILSILSTQINFIYVVKKLSLNNDVNYITSTLNIHPYRVKQTLNSIARVSLFKIENKLIKIAELDYKYKNAILNPENLITELII